MRFKAAENERLIFRVAQGNLLDRVVFCGGAVTGLLITDQASPDVNSTKDVDAIFEVASYGEYSGAQEELRSLGFTNDNSEDAPTCRFIINDIKLDLMPTDGTSFGWNTRFYPIAIASAWVKTIEVESEQLSVKVINAPLFVATKLEAFADRGKGDYFTSKDILDVMAVVEGREELLAEIAEQDSQVQQYLREVSRRLLSDAKFLDVVDYFGEDGRGDVILERLRHLTH